MANEKIYVSQTNNSDQMQNEHTRNHGSMKNNDGCAIPFRFRTKSVTDVNIENSDALCHLF